MAKIKDLGINIVPKTMQPPEIGGGGGGGTCMALTVVSDDTCSCMTGCECDPCTQTRQCNSADTCSCDTAVITVSNDGCQCHSCIGTPLDRTRITPHTPKLAPGMLSRGDVAALRAALRQALDNLDIAEKNSLPTTAEEIDAREKELQAELDRLKSHRDELKKKK